MTPFRETYGVAVPLMRPDIDTDQMISHHFLITRSRTGLGRGLFHAWRKAGRRGGSRLSLEQARLPATRRFCSPGRTSPAAPPGSTPSGPCSTTGYRVVIAPSFGVHFARNAVKNGLLPVVLPTNAVQELAAASEESAGARRVRVSLVDRVVALDGGPTYAFDIDDDARTALLEGLDGIGLTLVREPEITAFHLENLRLRPWLRATHG